ncbi:MAG: type VI secretion system baseplate subunit TssE [Acidobacteriales bacterium]|nr:type VI secretion system baseplate subunit TssE [Terriglobales bacterium]
MARGDADIAVTTSLLDRLIDLDPGNQADPPATRNQSVRQLKASLRRDLEWLLNTRRTPEEAPETFEHLSHSLFNYGLADVTSLALNSPRDKARLLRTIENVLADFEPRLANVRVRALDEGDNGGPRVLRFQIEGLLIMDPAPEQIFFDSVMQLSTGACQVKGE